MKSLGLLPKDFSFEDQKKIRELYSDTVYTKLSDVIRMNTKVARGGLDSCYSHDELGLGGMVDR